MLKKNSNVLISILVLLLYFIWPYFINVLLSGIFGLKGTGLLALTLVMNFALLFIVIYIYRDSLKRELTTFKNRLPKVLRTELIVFTGLLNALFEVLLANGGSGIELVFLIPISLFYMSFSYMYYKTDSVVTPIVYRMLYNIVPTFCNVVLAVIMICF